MATWRKNRNNYNFAIREKRRSIAEMGLQSKTRVHDLDRQQIMIRHVDTERPRALWAGVSEYLWGTGARSPPELGNVEKFGSFYVHNILSSPRLQWWAVVCYWPFWWR